jgi:hypothetical protein
METEKPYISIGTPMFNGSCYGMYALSLLGFSNACHQNGVGYEIFALANESLIPRARNKIVHHFLRTTCTHLMFIDADIGFDGSDILQLANADKDIIGGAYPKKGINWKKVEDAVKAGIPPEELNDYVSEGYVVNAHTKEPPKDLTAPYEVDYIGTGFMLIKRRVFEEMAPYVNRYKVDQSDEDWQHEFFATSIHPTRGVLLSEDYHFCDLWREHGDHDEQKYPGGQVFLDLRVRLSHIGLHVFTGAGVVNVPDKETT